MKLILIIFLAFFLCTCSAGTTNSSVPITTDHAVKYSFVTSIPLIDRIGDEYKALAPIADPPRNTGGRRINAMIVVDDPGSLTFEQKAETAMKAAIDIQQALNLDAVFVTLYPGVDHLEKFSVAQAYYSPDGKGFSGSDTGKFWEVRAAPGRFNNEFVPLEVYPVK